MAPLWVALRSLVEFLWALLGVLVYAAYLGLECHASPLPSKRWVVSHWFFIGLLNPTGGWGRTSAAVGRRMLSFLSLSFRRAFWIIAQDKNIGLWNVRKIFPQKTTLVTSVCRISVVISPVTLPLIFFSTIQSPRWGFKISILILHHLEKAECIKMIHCISPETRWSWELTEPYMFYLRQPWLKNHRHKMGTSIRKLVPEEKTKWAPETALVKKL